jgi:hypothetical protein
MNKKYVCMISIYFFVSLYGAGQSRFSGPALLTIPEVSEVDDIESQTPESPSERSRSGSLSVVASQDIDRVFGLDEQPVIHRRAVQPRLDMYYTYRDWYYCGYHTIGYLGCGALSFVAGWVAHVYIVKS